MKDFLSRYALFGLLLVLFVVYIVFDFNHYLSFDVVKSHHQLLMDWTHAHIVRSACLFVLLYIVVVATSVPVAAFLTLTAGFLFGPLLGSVLVISGATLGAFILYLAVTMAFATSLKAKASPAAKSMEARFRDHAFSYLLFLRLVPLFPFWLVNIVPALLGVSARVYLIATFIGIIPGSIIYVLVGNGLGHVFDTNQEPSFSLLSDPVIYIPLILLGVLSLVPVIYKAIKK